MINKIEEIIQKLINGDDSLLDHLKKELDLFFGNRDQSFIDNFSKENIVVFTNVLDLIESKKRLSEIDRAKLDYWLNNPMKKYLALKISKKVSDDELKVFANQIYNLDEIFTKKQRDEILNFISLFWLNGNDYHEDFYLENLKKGIAIQLYCGAFNKTEDNFSILVLAGKDLELILNKLTKSLNDY